MLPIGKRLCLGVALVAALVAACGSSAVPTPTPSASPSVETPTPSPTAVPSPTATPSALAPAALAYRTVQRYAENLLGGRYYEAWLILGSGSKDRWGSVTAFTTERTAFMKKAGASYTLKISPSNTLPLSSWVIGQPWASKIDQDHAFLFSLRWTGFGDDPHGTEIWIANPTSIGWELYLAN